MDFRTIRFSATYSHLLSVALLLMLGAVFPALAQDETSLREANMLYQDAIELQVLGKSTQAAIEFEKAVRRDRRILAEDDHGMLETLKKHYEGLLEKRPNDVKALEGMAFLKAVCLADIPGAIVHYEKILKLTSDPNVKSKTEYLVNRLRAMAEMTASAQQENAEQMREERLKNWAEMEKQEQLAELTDKAQAKASKIASLYRDKGELEARIPQLEDELKSLEEELAKAKRLWYSLKDNMYDRRRRRLEDDVASKKQELSTAKGKVEKTQEAIDDLERTGASGGAATSSGHSGADENADSGFGISGGGEQDPGQDDDQSGVQGGDQDNDQSGGQDADQGGTDADADAQSVVPTTSPDHPDFPEDGDTSRIFRPGRDSGQAAG